MRLLVCTMGGVRSSLRAVLKVLMMRRLMQDSQMHKDVPKEEFLAHHDLVKQRQQRRRSEAWHLVVQKLFKRVHVFLQSSGLMRCTWHTLFVLLRTVTRANLCCTARWHALPLRCV